MASVFNNLFEFDEYVLNARDKTLWHGDERIHLPAKAFETLQLLVERQGEVVAKEEILEAIWEGTFVEENNLSQKISILRKTFGADKNFIETVPKIGFRFVEPVRVRSNGFTNGRSSNGRPEGSKEDLVHADLPASENGEVNTTRSRSRLYLSLLGITVLAAAGAAAYIFLGYNGSAAQKPAATFDYTELTDTGDIDSSAISDDGKFIAFSQVPQDSRLGRSSLRLMEIGSKRAIDIAIEGDIQPGLVRFAPDGKSIYFRTRGKLNQHEKIYRISILGGEPKLIAERIWGSFAISPDGKHLTFVQREISGDTRKIVIQNIESGQQDVIVDSSESPDLKPHHVPAFSPDQKLLAFPLLERINDKAAIAVVDLSTKATRVIRTPLYSIDAAIWDPAADGLYINALELGSRFQLWHLSYPDGKLTRVTSDPVAYRDLSISRDGTLAVNRVEIYSNVWLIPDAKLERAQQLTRGDSELGGMLTAQFVPNGTILYNARFNAGSNIRVMNAGGENGRVFVDKQLKTEHNFSFSRSRGLVFFQFEERIWQAKFDGSQPQMVQLGDALEIAMPAVSHDDEWLYFVKREKDRDAIWKAPLAGGPAQLVYSAVDFTPETFLSASPDGKYLAFDYNKPEKIGGDGENSGRFRNYGLLDLATNELRVIEVPSYRSILRWTNGGTSFDFPSTTEKGTAIFRKKIDEDLPATKVFELENETIYRFDWSPDGKDLLIGRGDYKMNVVALRLRADK